MLRISFRTFLYKEESQEEDYDAIWEYFAKIMAPRHLAPLFHTAKALNIEVYTPFSSERLMNFMRNLPCAKKVGRKIEKELALMYLPKSVVERESVGFDAALESVAENEKQVFSGVN